MASAARQSAANALRQLLPLPGPSPHARLPGFSGILRAFSAEAAPCETGEPRALSAAHPPAGSSSHQDAKYAYAQLVHTLFQQAITQAERGPHTAEYEGLRMQEEQNRQNDRRWEGQLPPRDGAMVARDTSHPPPKRISQTMAALQYHQGMMDGTPRGRKLQANWQRQIILETRAVDAALARYRRDAESAMDRGAAASMPATRRLLTSWFGPLADAIREEQRKVMMGTSGMDRFVYGPYLLRLDPEQLAVIAMHGAINAFMSPEDDVEALGSAPGTARMTKLAISIGKAVETQYNVNKLEREIHARNMRVRAMRRLYEEGVEMRAKMEEAGWPQDEEVLWARWMQVGRELQSMGELMPTDHRDWFKEVINFQSRIATQLQNNHGDAPSWKQTYQMLSRAKRFLCMDSDSDWRIELQAKVGVILIKLMMDACKIDVMQNGRLQSVSAFWHGLEHGPDGKAGGSWKKYGLLYANEEVMRRIAVHHMAEAFIPQYLPMVIPPVPWQRYNLGGHLTLRSNAMRMRGSHLQRLKLESADAEMVEGRGPGLSQVYDALNALGSTAWSINNDVYRVVEAIWAWGGGICDIPSHSDVPVPPPVKPGFRLYNAGPGSMLLGTRLRNDIRWRASEISSARKRNTELHSLRCDMEYKLAIAREFSREERFYFPHNVDFRGRAYPLHPHLNHLGSDMCRGLLQFADTKPLGPKGLHWLYVQAANLWGQGVDKLPLDGRIKWVQENLGAILDNAADPFRRPTGVQETFPESTASVLAATASSDFDAMALESASSSTGPASEARDGRTVLRSLMADDQAIDAATPYWWRADSPFQFLATCFDVHRALASGDPASYRSRLPVHQDGSCNGLQHYAALGRDQTGGWAVNLCPVDRPQDVYTEIARLVAKRVEADAAAGVQEAQTLLASTSVDRKLVKQTVMTSVYGVTYVGARTQITARLKERGFEDNRELYLVSCYSARVTLECLHEMFQSAKFIMQWLNECARLVAGSDAAVAWTTPLGLPVVQPYRRKTHQHVRTVVQRLIIATDNDVKPVMKQRQRTAFPPNFIHSIDSSHMMLTAIACHEAGLDFAGVHDSFWTHAGTVDTMNVLLREKFIELHSQPLLENLVQELQDQHPGISFPPLPLKGTFDLGAVRQAMYFFS